MEGNDLLNSVMLFLPYYDRDQVQAVVARLQAEGESGGSETGDAAEFQTLNVAKGKEPLLAIYRMLPTYSGQEGRKIAHLRRALRFALELAKDGWYDDAVTVRDGLRNALLKIGDERHKDPAFVEQIQGMSKISYRTLRVENGVLKQDDPGEVHSLAVTEQDVDAVFSGSFVTLTEDLAISYLSARYDPEDENVVYWRIKSETFLLSQDASVVSRLEDQAQRLLEEIYEKRKPDIAQLPTERQAPYRRIMQTSRDFKATEPAVPEPLRLKSDKNATAQSDHLFVNEKGTFDARFNSWEAAVLSAAKKQSGFAGWLRNYARKPWSIAYTYTDSEGKTVPGYPDFVLFRKEGKHIVVDLLEPHNPKLSDSLAKAHGLCKFADEHGGMFGHIEWIKLEGSHIKRLNLNSTKVRAAVLGTKVDGAIDTLFDAFGTVDATT